MAGTTAKRTYVRHDKCYAEGKHGNTRAEREQCRRERQEQAAALEQRAQRTEVLLDATEEQDRQRDSKGRYARLTPDQWRALLEDLDTASSWLVNNSALEEARLVLTLGGVTLEAVYHIDEGWSVGPVTD